MLAFRHLSQGATVDYPQHRGAEAVTSAMFHWMESHFSQTLSQDEEQRLAEVIGPLECVRAVSPTGISQA